MSKLSVSILVISLFCFTAAWFDDEDESQADSVAEAHLPGFPDGWLNIPMPVMPDFPAIVPLTADDIRDLKKNNPDAVVKGSSSRATSSRRWIDGVEVENKSSGDAIVNDDGDVQEVSY